MSAVSIAKSSFSEYLFNFLKKYFKTFNTKSNSAFKNVAKNNIITSFRFEGECSERMSTQYNYYIPKIYKIQHPCDNLVINHKKARVFLAKCMKKVRNHIKTCPQHRSRSLCIERKINEYK